MPLCGSMVAFEGDRMDAVYNRYGKSFVEVTGCYLYNDFIRTLIVIDSLFDDHVFSYINFALVRILWQQPR